MSDYILLYEPLGVFVGGHFFSVVAQRDAVRYSSNSYSFSILRHIYRTPVPRLIGLKLRSSSLAKGRLQPILRFRQKQVTNEAIRRKK